MVEINLKKGYSVVYTTYVRMYLCDASSIYILRAPGQKKELRVRKESPPKKLHTCTKHHGPASQAAQQQPFLAPCIICTQVTHLLCCCVPPRRVYTYSWGKNTCDSSSVCTASTEIILLLWLSSSSKNRGNRTVTGRGPHSSTSKYVHRKKKHDPHKTHTTLQ